jgi:cytochrome d ubiquinol oxidase subunit II
MNLEITWFALVFVLLGGYAILDGFDLGVGILHLLTRDEGERRVALNAIGPVWDGNEVWLLTGGGALFAAFPPVYATVFSGFYIALMLLLAALIARAVAIEFRSKVESPRWRAVWDVVFCLGSLLPAVLFGVAFGNILRGVPIDANGDFTGSFVGLLNPFSILVGLLAAAACAMHGALYLAGKSEGVMRQRLARTVPKLWTAFAILYVLAAVCAYFVSPFLFETTLRSPPALALAAIALASVAAILSLARRQKFGAAWVASAAVIGLSMALSAWGLFPRMVPSLTNLDYSLTIYNSSSTHGTLLAMLIIALIGMPIVIVYSVLIHRVFRGKVVLEEGSY